MSKIKEPDKLEKLVGILFPVFSMRREADLGIGDTTSVCMCLDWLKKYSVNFLQLLPVNVSSSDNSPYSAISSVALDFIYLDVLKIPEVNQADIDYAKAKYNDDWLISEKVDYEKVRRVKSSVLRLAYEKFIKQTAVHDFELFKQTEADWLMPFCKYSWLIEEADENEDWSTWPEKFDSPDKAEQYIAQADVNRDGEASRKQDFYAWLQWHAFNQWRSVREYATKLGVKLMGDIPIGVANSSADVFFEPQWFQKGWYGGAPPEKVFKDDAFTCKWGQNWGVPLYNWEALKEDDFLWWKRRINKLTDIFNMFRIDHILGFYRIYAFPWHPKRNSEFLPLSEEEAMKLTLGELPHFSPRDDTTLVNKARNLLAGDEYIKALQAAAGGAEVIGEDLGCVPDYVRPHLSEVNIAGFKVCHWETNDHGEALMPEDHPYCSFATYTTHDHPSLSAMWDEMIKMCNTDCGKSRKKLKIICQFANINIMKVTKPPKYNDTVKWSLIKALLNSTARYSALMITDIIDSRKRINVPGTVTDANWSYRVNWEFGKEPPNVAEDMEKLKMNIKKFV